MKRRREWVKGRYNLLQQLFCVGLWGAAWTLCPVVTRERDSSRPVAGWAARPSVSVAAATDQTVGGPDCCRALLAEEFADSSQPPHAFPRLYYCDVR